MYNMYLTFVSSSARGLWRRFRSLLPYTSQDFETLSRNECECVSREVPYLHEFVASSSCSAGINGSVEFWASEKFSQSYRPRPCCRQEAALCGMHCLNNLVQAPTFDVADLSEIAHQLDALERAAMSEGGLQTNVLTNRRRYPLSATMNCSGISCIHGRREQQHLG